MSGSPHRLGALGEVVAARLAAFDGAGVPGRIWTRDPTVWADDPATPEIADRLGWLGVADAMAGECDALAAFAEDARRSFDRVVLCGMGGSSLAPEVLARTFGARAGWPALHVLDSTHPAAVAGVERDAPLARTLFVIASKSGTTQESDCFLRYFWERAGGRGAQFVAITDPGTPLAALAAARGFRRAFLNPADIGGRYSALSFFGLVPAALAGIDVRELLARARAMAAACARAAPAEENPGAWLGAVLGEAARAGRDKATFVLSPGIASCGLWVEQLIAESTGKHGKGIVPVTGEALGAAGVYGADRVFVELALAGEDDRARAGMLDMLERSGHPVLRFTLPDRAALGAEFFRWEFATAAAGAVLRINPFDQPNVAESKANTKRVLAERRPPRPPDAAAALAELLDGARPGDYVALQAYVAPAADTDRRLAAIQAALRDRLRVAVTAGYGPRFLHSTGQLHKGGPPRGRFIQIVEAVAPAADVAIPGEPYTFGALIAAQAEGDFEALRSRGRPVVRVAGLEALER